MLVIKLSIIWCITHQDHTYESENIACQSGHKKYIFYIFEFLACTSQRSILLKIRNVRNKITYNFMYNWWRSHLSLWNYRMSKIANNSSVLKICLLCSILSRLSNRIVMGRCKSAGHLYFEEQNAISTVLIQSDPGVHYW